LENKRAKNVKKGHSSGEFFPVFYIAWIFEGFAIEKIIGLL